MSTTIVASAVSILAIVLPYFGLEIGTEQLTEIIQSVVVIFSAIWVWYRRTQNGDVNMLGFKV